MMLFNTINLYFPNNEINIIKNGVIEVHYLIVIRTFLITY